MLKQYQAPIDIQLLSTNSTPFRHDEDFIKVVNGYKSDTCFTV